ncbi:hypothetical protein NDU88_003609 [Pleurodeles waltl]|uniref:Uncharacterized protein n=1 Tax=Pleurodeles waltl TaxID=8319 RepID=A0AAV7Q9F1_PLEWA|nr:hypothetical protein NDU88_003609 [Pleurodeles waltl]
MLHLETTLEKHTAVFYKVLQAIQDSKTAMETLLGTIHIRQTVGYGADQVATSVTAGSPRVFQGAVDLSQFRSAVGVLPGRVGWRVGRFRGNILDTTPESTPRMAYGGIVKGYIFLRPAHAHHVVQQFISAHPSPMSR